MKQITNKLIFTGYLVLPLYLIPLFVAAFFYPGYSHISQHASVLNTLDSPVYPYYSWFATVLGIAMISFTIGIFIKLKKLNRPYIASISMLLISSIAFCTNGIFPMGGPLHGLYNLVFFSLIAPILCLVDIGEKNIKPWYRNFTIIVTIGGVLYLWGMITRLDPQEYRGLTQRLFGTLYYSWFAATAYVLRKK